MFKFVSLMAVGAVIGSIFREKDKIHKVPALIHVLVCTLMFLLGLSIGINKMLVSHFGYYCSQAAIIATLSVLGSMIASYLVYRFFFMNKKGMHHEK